MSATSILSSKDGEVISIEPTATLATASILLSSRRVGAIVVLGAGGRIAGILSERDIIRALAERGAAALDDAVAQVMTRDVMTCMLGDSTLSIMERMTSGRFRHMPVTDNGRFIGILSIGDVVKDLLDTMPPGMAAGHAR